MYIYTIIYKYIYIHIYQLCMPLYENIKLQFIQKAILLIYMYTCIHI